MGSKKRPVQKNAKKEAKAPVPVVVDENATLEDLLWVNQEDGWAAVEEGQERPHHLRDFTDALVLESASDMEAYRFEVEFSSLVPTEGRGIVLKLVLATAPDKLRRRTPVKIYRTDDSEDVEDSGEKMERTAFYVISSDGTELVVASDSARVGLWDDVTAVTAEPIESPTQAAALAALARAKINPIAQIVLKSYEGDMKTAKALALEMPKGVACVDDTPPGFLNPYQREAVAKASLRTFSLVQARSFIQAARVPLTGFTKTLVLTPCLAGHRHSLFRLQACIAAGLSAT